MEISIGVNINDDSQPFTDLILNGEKTIETRNTPTLRPYVGKRVGIISTSKKRKAKLVGYIDIVKEIEYTNEKQFDSDYNKHLVNKDSPFYIKDVKYGYVLSNPERIEPRDIDSKGIISRSLIKEGIELQDEEVTAYHATPHSFDKFSTQHMGKGGGAQAFGWGLYFSDSEDIAKYYAKKFGEKYIYKVTLHKGKTPEQYTWLEFNKPLNKELVNKLTIAVNSNDKLIKTSLPFKLKNYKLYKGNDIYGVINLALKSPKEASLFLLHAGIDGIKYPSPEGNGFNYVVFNENAVTIEKQTQLEEMEISKKDLIQNWLNNPKKLKEDNDLMFEHRTEQFKITKRIKQNFNDVETALKYANRFAPTFSNSLEKVVNSTNALDKVIDIKKEPSLREKANKKPINEINDILRASLYFKNQKEIVKFCNNLLDGRFNFPDAEIIEYDGRRLFRAVGDNPYRGAVHLLLLLKGFNTYMVVELQLMLDKQEEKAKIHKLYKIKNPPVNNPNYVKNRMDKEFGRMLGEKKPKYYSNKDYKNKYYGEINENFKEITKGELEEEKKKKADRCTRIAKSKYDVWPSAYASGAVVKCRQGKIWKGLKEEDESLDNYPKELIKKAHDAITRRKGKDYAPDVHELQAWIDNNQESLDEKTDFSKEKEQGLHGWFARQGGKGKSKGWVDCNTCRDGKCKSCGRKEGESRAKYPACRPTPSACKSKGKGDSWGKKS